MVMAPSGSLHRSSDPVLIASGRHLVLVSAFSLMHGRSICNPQKFNLRLAPRLLIPLSTERALWCHREFEFPIDFQKRTRVAFAIYSAPDLFIVSPS